MDSLSFGIPNRFQKSVELTFNYSCSIIFIGHDEREIAVTIRETPVTFRRNHRSRWREIRIPSHIVGRA